MELAPGTHVGPYEIRSLLGRGGMGSVYRAADTRLGREVAIKALPKVFAGDPDRLARFEREARVLASLNHAHIATLHGVEHEGALLVMELVPGETLAERISRGPLPVPEALSLLGQVAEALDAAHEGGVVHRDLKPANIMVTPEGRVKVLDFGLAKALAVDGEPPADSELATLTATGTVVGTTAYMSPEQARGLTVDRRTDVWSFGCVLYEALTGRRAFSGSTVSDTIAAVLERTPDWAALPAATPPSVRRLLRRCLEKDLRRRPRHLDPAQLDGDEASIAEAAPTLPKPRRPLAAATTLVAAAVTFALGFALARSRATPLPEWARQPVVMAIHPPAGVELADGAPAVSPDGTRVAFVGTSRGATGLWIRALDQPEATLLAGTSGASLPFWSADGRSLAFFAESRLRRVDLATGTAHAFVDTPRVSVGGDWSREGVILYSTRAELMRIATAGGEAAPVARLDASHFEDSLRYPQFLPDGRRYLYVARSGRPEESAAYAGSLADGTTRRLFPVQSKVRYDSGHLIYARDGALIAQRFDPATLRTSGEATPIVPSVEQRANSLMAFFSTSSNGVLAYRKESASRNELRWLDRTGRVLGSLGGPEAKGVINQVISPSGDRIAFDEFDNRTGVRAVWIADVRAGSRSRLTFSGSDWAPVWSPDGRQIAFRSHRDGQPNVYRRSADGAGVDERVLEPGLERSPRDWSPDGRFLAYQEAGWLYAVPLAGGQPITIGAEGNGVGLRFSPSGDQVAYASDESGQLEVYVQPFPPTGAKWQVSSAGGTHPRWRGDGRELFYIGRDLTLRAVDVEPGATFRAGVARALFKVDATAMGGGANKYDVTRDGQRFLVNSAYDPPASDPILVVLNWPALLQR